MTTLQPILALVMALLCGLLSTVPKGVKRFCVPNLWSIVGYAALLIAADCIAIKFGHIDDRRAIIFCTATGGGVAILAAILGELSFGVGASLAVSGACMAHLVRADAFPAVGLAYAFAVSMSVLFFPSRLTTLTAAIVGAIIPMADYLGKAQWAGAQRAIIGVALGLALCAATVIFLGFQRAVPRSFGKMGAVLATILGAAAGYAVAKWSIGGDLWIIVGVSAIACLVVHWLIPPDAEPIPLRIGIATVIWLSLGTIGFSLLKGFGISAAMVEAIFVLALLGNGRAILTTGPALGLVAFRVLREASPDFSKAFDIGQHYGITAVVIGAILPCLFWDWRTQQRSEKPILDSIGNLLWGFILVSLPVLSIVVLGAKGSSGVVVGLGLSGFILMSRGCKSVLPLAAAMGAAIANTAAVDWVGESLSLSRGEKLHSFGYWTGAVAIAAIGIVVVSKPKSQEAVQ